MNSGKRPRSPALKRSVISAVLRHFASDFSEKKFSLRYSSLAMSVGTLRTGLRLLQVVEEMQKN